MSKIFISYKQKDKDTVLPIVKAIKQETGMDCWIDLEGIEGGDLFQNVIIDAIDQADIVVAMLSQNFIAPYRDGKTGKPNPRKPTYTQKEVMYALSEDKRIVPLSIDGTTVNDCKWLKFNCSGLDSILWSDKAQREKLLANMRRWHSEDAPRIDLTAPQIVLPLPSGFQLTLRKDKQRNCYIGEIPVADIMAALGKDGKEQHISLKDAAMEVLETAGVSTVASYMLNPIVGAGIVGYKLWSKLSSGGKQSEEEMLDSIIAGLNAQYGIHIHRQDAGSPGHTVVLEC